VPGDTIAAIATGPAPAALGIVRVSGPRAAEVLEAVVPGARAVSRPRRLCQGRAIDPRTRAPIDDVLCAFARGPRTVTGEDVAEIQGHGGPVVMRALLEAALAAGARAAAPGEFTSRAFLSGRIDLTQAEAVMGLVGARSARAARAALRQLDGGIRERLDGEYAGLTRAAAELEAGLDFPDEDLPLARASEIAWELRRAAASLDALAATFAHGARLARGAFVAIVGPPNAGKSSLLNRLAGAERALVDAEPGTTRDVVEVDVELNGVPVRLCDTAGLREPVGRVEALGIEKGAERARGADAVLAVLDGADGAIEPSAIDRAIVRLELGPAAVVVALNKSDLPGWRGDRVPPGLAGARCVAVSAATGAGCEDLAKAIGEALAEDEDPCEIVLTTVRQHRAVAEARDGAEKAAALLEQGAFPELAAAEVRFAREALAALFGTAADEDLLAAVFSSFCLGK
jgi:tRNA modification GTPase